MKTFARSTAIVALAALAITGGAVAAAPAMANPHDGAHMHRVDVRGTQNLYWFNDSRLPMRFTIGLPRGGYVDKTIQPGESFNFYAAFPGKYSINVYSPSHIDSNLSGWVELSPQGNWSDLDCTGARDINYKWSSSGNEGTLHIRD